MTLVLDKQSLTAEVIPRPSHTISRDDISKPALKVLYRLHKAGFQAYLVGGSVRDILLSKHPKDFDVVTDATPEQVRKLFKNSLIIGRRFKLVHVRFGHDIVEVATFRREDAGPDNRTHKTTGMIIRDNVYGDIEDDVLRRDFTVNALYYNIADFSIVDYVNGMADVEARTIRLLGEPEQRYREDPVRMLRAIRFAAKLGFSIEDKTSDAILSMKELLANVAPARLFDELVKMSLCGSVTKVYDLLFEYDIFAYLFPLAAHFIEKDQTGAAKHILQIALQETDNRIADGKTINPAFLIAVTFWPAMQQHIKQHTDHGTKLYPAIEMAISEVLKLMAPLTVPKRLLMIVKDIWTLQYHLTQTRRNRIFRCLYHSRFRAAYDFLLIRERAGETELNPLCEFWTTLQEASQDEQERLIAQRQDKKPRKSTRPHHRRRRSRGKKT